MRLPALLRRRGAPIGAAAALVLLAGLAAALPGASGGFTAKIANSTDTAGTASFFTCQPAIAADSTSALFQWPLQDATGATTAADVSGNGRTGTYSGTVTADSTTPIGCPRDSGSAIRFDGSTTYITYPTKITNPQTFSLEAAFQTSVKGGKIIGFGGSATGASSTYDRQLYINKNGGIVFGVYNSGYHVITSPASTYADGNWHHVAATFSSTNGMRLYVDGSMVASDPASTVAENASGYWRVGYDSIGSSWSNAPTNLFFTGRMRNVAVYTVELSAQQIANHAAPTFGS